VLRRRLHRAIEPIVDVVRRRRYRVPQRHGDRGDRAEGGADRAQRHGIGEQRAERVHQ
jgi:hypothetical protein